jgi:hypothetical protein
MLHPCSWNGHTNSYVPALTPTGECDKELQKLEKLEKLAEDASIAKEQLVEAASTARQQSEQQQFTAEEQVLVSIVPNSCLVVIVPCWSVQCSCMTSA